MPRVPRIWFCALLFLLTALLSAVPTRAQWIPPTGGDPVAVACPNGPASGEGIDALDAWEQGRNVASIEGDGFMGIGNWGHTLEALQWYCKASAAGNALAAYDIGEIFREGYVVNSNEPGGRIITKHYDPDPQTAFYWYKLSADRGFTKAMLAVAQFYALGPALDGSKVTKDLQKSSALLKTAADDEDTTALLILAARYAGIQTAPWAMALPLQPDRAKALDALSKAAAILTHYNEFCNDPDIMSDMAGSLPDASEGREVRASLAVEMHGTDDAYPMEAECLLSLGPPPESQQENESGLEQFYALLHGSAVNNWSFSFFRVPGSKDTVFMRETATQAITEGMEEMAALVQLLGPPATPQPQ